MKRKQPPSLPWGRFGYVILIIIKFGELLLWISPRIIYTLKNYIKLSKECLIRYQNTSKSIEKNSACASFFNPLLSVWISDETLFLVFDIIHTKFQNEPHKKRKTFNFEASSRGAAAWYDKTCKEKKEWSTKLQTTVKKTTSLLYRIFLTSSATFCFAMALFTFSYITVFWIAIPQKIANAYMKTKETM